MNRQNQLIKNTLILALGKVSTQLIAFGLLPLYTLYISPHDYGIIDLIITYVTLLVPALTIQLEMAAFRFLIDVRGDVREKTRIISNVLQIVIPIVALIIATSLTVNSFVFIPYSNLALLIICTTIFSNIFLQFARGMGNNKQFAIASVVTGITTLVSAVTLIVYAHMEARGLLLSIGLANLVCVIYLFIALKLYKYISFKNRDKDLQKRLVMYSSPLIPNGMSWWVINVSDRTIISIFISVAANGIYAVSNRYAAIFSSMFAIFSMSWTESASVHIDDKDRNTFFSETINASVKFFGSLGLILIAFIPLVFNLLVNAKFHEAYLYIPILILAAFFNAIVGLYSGIYVAKKLTKQVASTSIVAAIINIVLNLLFIKLLGIYAAAISTVVAYLVMSVYRHYDVKKYVTITYEKNIFVKIGALYAITMLLYYYNTITGNIVNIVTVSAFALLLNKSIIKVAKNKIFGSAYSKQKKLPATQIVEEELYEESL